MVATLVVHRQTLVGFLLHFCNSGVVTMQR